MKNELIHNIFDLLAEKNTVIFFGAGVSMNSGIPIVKGGGANEGIVNNILDSLGLPVEEATLLESLPFEAFIQNLTMGSSIAQLLDIFDVDTPNHAHRFMARAAKQGIVTTFVTTNFDGLLEKSMDELGVGYRQFRSDTDFSQIDWKSDEVKIVKLHGSIEDKSELAVTIQKVAAKNNSNVFKDVVTQVFNSGTHKNVLVLGYSCSDLFDISPIILSKQTDAGPHISFIEHTGSDETHVEAVSDAVGKNPFKKHQGFRYRLNTDTCLIELSRQLGLGSLEIERHGATDWQMAVKRWVQTSVHSKGSIFAKMFSDISNFLLADKYATEAIKAADDDAGAGSRLTCYLNLVPLLTGLGKYDEAEKLAEEMTALAMVSGDWNALVQAHLNLSEAQLRSNKYQLSLDNLLLAEKWAPFSNNQPITARILANAADSFIALGRIDEARTYLDRAEQLADATGEIHTKAIIYRGFARVCEATGEFEQCFSYLEKALPLCQQLGYKYFEAATWIDLGQYYQDHTGNIKQAIRCFSEAEKIARDTGNVQQEAFARGNSGICYFGLGRLQEAQHEFDFAVENMRGLLGATYRINYGFLLDAQDNFTAASCLFEEAISILEKDDSYSYKNELRRAYHNLTNSLLSLNNASKAKYSAQKSLEISIELNQTNEEIRSRANLGLALIGMGNGEDGLIELGKAVNLAQAYHGNDNPVTKQLVNLFERKRLQTMNFAYYIEQCQLCLSRGKHHSCGWCTDDDTDAGDGRVKLPKDDQGYPYHNHAHSSRKYYDSKGQHIPDLDGRNPPC